MLFVKEVTLYQEGSLEEEMGMRAGTLGGHDGGH